MSLWEKRSAKGSYLRIPQDFYGLQQQIKAKHVPEREIRSIGIAVRSIDDVL